MRVLPDLKSASHFKSDRAIVVARRLRREVTPAEQAFWFELRRRRLEGTHFRRQTPIGSSVVDFACHGAKLIVEVDGGAHDAPDVAFRDVERQRWIEGRGYRVLRFKNLEMLKNVRGVADAIFAEARVRMTIQN